MESSKPQPTTDGRPVQLDLDDGSMRALAGLELPMLREIDVGERVHSSANALAALAGIKVGTGPGCMTVPECV
jgi:hypothetical protein